MKTEEAWEKEFDDKWGSEIWAYRHNGGDTARAVRTTAEVKEFISRQIHTAKKEVLEEFQGKLALGSDHDYYFISRKDIEDIEHRLQEENK